MPNRTRTVRSLIITLAGAAAIALVPAPAPAQNEAPTTRPSQTRVPAVNLIQPASQRPEEPRFDLRFEGGTVADYLEAIQNASGIRNIVTMHGLDQIPMPQVQLDQVTTGAAVAVLDNTRHTTDAGSEYEVYFRSFEGVYTVRVLETRRSVPRQQHEQQATLGTRIHPLAELIEYGAYPAEAILSAIESALDMSEDSSAQLRYHEETRTLFVRANAIDQHIVNAVLEALFDQVEVMTGIVTPEQQLVSLEEQIRAEQRNLDSFEMARHNTMLTMDELRARIRSLQEQAADAPENAQPDRALEIELETAAQSLHRAAARAENLEQEVQNARSRLSQLRDKHADLKARLERPEGAR